MELERSSPAVRCPRCDSTSTKFCYFNNYSRAQPRHFCKTCKRYWTRGGTLRNVPVGGGCRKNKRQKKPSLTTTTTTTTTASSSSSTTTISLLPTAIPIPPSLLHADTSFTFPPYAFPVSPYNALLQPSWESLTCNYPCHAIAGAADEVTDPSYAYYWSTSRCGPSLAPLKEPTCPNFEISTLEILEQ